MDGEYFQMFGLATVSKHMHNFSDNGEFTIHTHTHTHLTIELTQ